MTGVVKVDYSPKKGKENKNVSNHIPVSNTLKKNTKNESKNEMTPKKDKTDSSSGPTVTNKKLSSEKKPNKVVGNSPANGSKEEEDSSSCSTTNRTIRPQTKILRRPTPNLNHPVIQVDSDDSGGDSSSSDKSKEDNPKRQKMGNENADSSSHKPKNFIMYNKYNVDKNTKNAIKERNSATLASSIPNPCNSCSRSQAPERLHSHARKDARGLMNRRSPALDVKMTSPQKKPLDNLATKNKLSKSSPPSPNCSKEEDTEIVVPEILTPSIQTVNAESASDISVSNENEQNGLEKDLAEPAKACYICQKEFKVSFLLVHESKCLEVS